MRLKVLWILLAFVPAIRADVINCTGGAVSVPVFNPSSISGAVGDYTLDCTGGIPTPPGDTIPQVDFSALMNVPVLNPGTWILTDGVKMTTGTFDGPDTVKFLGVPLNAPGAGHVVFTVENVLVNPSLEPPGFQFTENVYINGDASTFITNQQQVVAVNAVPEPFMLVFVGLGLGAMWLARKGS
jgi:hypothetical protein